MRPLLYIQILFWIFIFNLESSFAQTWTNFIQEIDSPSVYAIDVDSKGNKRFGTSEGLSKFEDAYITISDTLLNVLKDEGSITSFTISSNTQWEISTETDWLTIRDTIGTDNDTITFTALENPNASALYGFLTIYGDKFKSLIKDDITEIEMNDYISGYYLVKIVNGNNKVFLRKIIK